MAHKSFSAPKVWRRPYTSIYNDNYRFGNSLYSGAVADIENRSKGYTPYFASPNSASLITDPGVRRAILEAELLTSSDILPSGMMENALHNSAVTASQTAAAVTNSANALSSSVSKEISSRTMISERKIEESSTTTRRRGSDSYNTYASARELADLESGLEESRLRRRRAVANRPTTIYVSNVRSGSPHRFMYDSDQGVVLTGDGSLPPAGAHRQDWTLERWYAKAVRNAHKPQAFPVY
jgi:hypothetical protein